MPRWEPNAAGRLQQAAIDLFTAQGYERTTVAEIAARAGVTERTFFNHFSHKRDVLFGPNSDRLTRVTAREIAASPAGTTPLTAVLHGLRAAAGEVLDGLQEPAARRRGIIEATPELQEREESKRAALAAAMAGALRDRGVDDTTARLAAGIGLLVHQTAEHRWTEPGAPDSLPTLLTEAMTALRTIIDT
ncbi:TetR family transcriptional regulator [Actinoplanes sp. NBRC 14428]|uniref:TetR family transcriptional regulator n=1 Tax=Pseudosporangium ferrugineum TaxID=439699 RepID=A0A2T0RHY8_9ACTN|nr:TetR/AcrR family transcriptional regulator [Pseudosporangium ferrugineum]PRY20785.1 TetR family transcriptional regulator [Pseudosporangium ferrugineum]BCJ50638.1 TetR family transcriptional regulator [Actinoplanes sp. NBRC 14428]